MTDVRVKLAGLSFASMEKLGYYKVSQQEFGFLESIPVGIKKGKPSGRIRKQLK
jgi:regulator of sigma E protease